MGIGVGIFLLAFGAILTFAVDWRVAGLDLHAVGWILMAAGVIGLLFFTYFWSRRRALPPSRHGVQSDEPALREDLRPPPL